MFQSTLNETGKAVQAHLAQEIAKQGDLNLHKAMAYATAGGKGLRGFLVMESAKVFGITGGGPLQAASAVEAMHAYSLVHDDLPAMDDDDLRRGNPTVHVAWDEATAVLVGDALQALAFELLADHACHADPMVRSNLVLGLARAAGGSGMVMGQAEDIAAETAETPLGLSQITGLQSRKTGALIEWSATAGAVMAGADPTPLRHYAQNLGLAFQIVDDVLDEEGDAEEVGKAVRKDADAGKATFVSLMGLQPAKDKAQNLVDQACDVIDGYGPKADLLKATAQFVVARKK